MSTRCNIIIKDAFGSAIFYRHSDGYPEGVKSTLQRFMALLRAGKIRDNVSQAAGWLILIGHEEYIHIGKTLAQLERQYRTDSLNDWKVGAYEPTTDIHGDIEYLYEIDLAKKTLRGWKHDGEAKGEEVSFEAKAA